MCRGCKRSVDTNENMRNHFFFIKEVKMLGGANQFSNPLEHEDI